MSIEVAKIGRITVNLILTTPSCLDGCIPCKNCGCSSIYSSYDMLFCDYYAVCENCLTYAKVSKIELYRNSADTGYDITKMLVEVWNSSNEVKMLKQPI